MRATSPPQKKNGRGNFQETKFSTTTYYGKIQVCHSMLSKERQPYFFANREQNTQNGRRRRAKGNLALSLGPMPAASKPTNNGAEGRVWVSTSVTGRRHGENGGGVSRAYGWFTPSWPPPKKSTLQSRVPCCESGVKRERERETYLCTTTTAPSSRMFCLCFDVITITYPFIRYDLPVRMCLVLRGGPCEGNW